MYRLLLLLLLLLLTACGSSRRAVREEKRIDEKIVRTDSVRECVFIDTTRRESGVLEIVRIKFAPDLPLMDLPPITTSGGTTLPGRVLEAEIVTSKEEKEEAGITETSRDSVANMNQAREEEGSVSKETEISTFSPWHVLGIILGLLALSCVGSYLRKKFLFPLED